MSNTILSGDCIQKMRSLAEASVHCCITSPPYFGLRDYGHAGQIGLEATPEAYVEKLVDVFREVRRVLRDDGTLWLNIGDSYNNFRSQMGPGQQIHGREKMNGKPAEKSRRRGWRSLKEKDLVGIPWRVAFALQSDGWYLRQDIIWHKPNPMPESVTDRCTKAHEYVFLLSKSARYHFDAAAIKEPANPKNYRGNPTLRAVPPGQTAQGTLEAQRGRVRCDTRNKRDVWSINARGFKGAHFAVFPEKLVEPCILAGCPVGGTVLDPFGGSGTVGVVAKQHGRNAILCELNPDYVEIAKKRAL